MAGTSLSAVGLAFLAAVGASGSVSGLRVSKATRFAVTAGFWRTLATSSSIVMSSSSSSSSSEVLWSWWPFLPAARCSICCGAGRGGGLAVAGAGGGGFPRARGLWAAGVPAAPTAPWLERNSY